MLEQALRRRILAEMGYPTLRWRGRAPAPSAPAPALPERPAQALASADPVTDPLWTALLRAVGAVDLDTAELGWERRQDGPAFDFDGPILRINLEQLRRQPRAKRELWKTLRALRRQLAGPAPRRR